MTLTAFPPPDPDTVAARSAALEPAAPTLPPKTQPTGKSRRVATLVLVLAGLAAVMVLLAVAALPVLQDDNEDVFVQRLDRRLSAGRQLDLPSASTVDDEMLEAVPRKRRR